MVFLSAQPDEIYFLWQLELQIFNFSKCGIGPEQIHVLIGYNPRKGLHPEFGDMIRSNRSATFFVYPDERKGRYYPPSIRPHLLKQHFKRHPYLRQEGVFYHDADIIFREMPDFSKMDRVQSLYVSDTRNYLDTGYIKGAGSVQLLDSLCRVIGVSRDLIEKTDEHAGGAQYFFHSTSITCFEFWDKVEKDCELLFDILERYNNGQEELSESNNAETRRIQGWCADMWAVLWNTVLSGVPVAISRELDFCWPSDDIAKWDSTRILHIAGVPKKDKEALFCKTEFIFHKPYYEHFEGIDTKKCSTRYVDLIKDYRNMVLDHKRVDLSDMTFLIPIRIDSVGRLENLHIILRYLEKYFKTNIIILEADSKPHFSRYAIYENVRYEFIMDENRLFHRTKYNNLLIGLSETPIISLYDCDVIVPVHQILQSVNTIRKGEAAVLSPYDGSFVNVDNLFKLMMEKLLDDKLLEYNCPKFPVSVKRSYGGAVMLDKKSFIEAGAENEYLTSWGPDDIERIKRMEILGYGVKRVPGPLYHLPHPRYTNSFYASWKIREKLMGEYLKICSLKKRRLENYIRSWPWGCQATQ